MNTSTNYLESTRLLFAYYKGLGERAMAQIPEEALFKSPSENSNSIAVIVKHLAGNMLSRWTDFLTSDGEKEWRNREDEFTTTIDTRDALMSTWDKGWQCVLETTDSLMASDLGKIVYIRNEGHTVVEAINRQVTHYAYHVGQIVYLCRMYAGERWQSLTIPKGDSEVFNARKFAEDKRRAYFLDSSSDT